MFESQEQQVDFILEQTIGIIRIWLFITELTDECIEKRKKQLEESAKRWGMTVDELSDIEQRTRKELKTNGAS